MGKIFSEAFRFKNLFNIIISKLNKKYNKYVIETFYFYAFWNPDVTYRREE